MAGQRRRHADDHHIGLGQPAEIRSGLEAPLGDRAGHDGGGNVLDEGLAPVEPLHPRRVDVEPEHPVPGLRGGERQGEAHIAQPDHTDERPALREGSREAVRVGARWCGGGSGQQRHGWSVGGRPR
jgi:hypothetical protein